MGRLYRLITKLEAVVDTLTGLMPQKHRTVDDPWRTFAVERNLHYSSSYSGSGSILPKRRTLTGSVNGISMRIDLGDLAKVRAHTSSAIEGKMCAYSDNTLVDVVTIAADALPNVGDEEFDAHFFLRGTDPAVAEQLLTADVRQAMMRFPLGICMNYDSGMMSIAWAGDAAMDALAVEAACAIIATACNTRVSAGAYR